MKSLNDEDYSCKMPPIFSSIREDLEKIVDKYSIKKLNHQTNLLATRERIINNIYRFITDELTEITSNYLAIQSNKKEQAQKETQFHDKITQEKQTTITKVYSENMAVAEESLSYIDSRYKRFLQTAQKLNEVNQMFFEMLLLVQEQSEFIDRISFQISHSKEDIREATKELREAKKIKRDTKCMVQ
jgi:t-SNARE complex subunit (syntaxin)